MTDRPEVASRKSPPRSVELRLAIAGLLTCAIVILGITMWPHPVDRGHEGTVATVLDGLYAVGVPRWFGYAQLEFTANILMFVPLGFFLMLVVRPRHRWIAFVLPPIASSSIELTQLLFISERFATLSDVVANSLGGWIGAVIAFLIVRNRR